MRVKLAETVAHSEDAMEMLEAATESDEASGPVGFFTLCGCLQHLHGVLA